MGRRAVRRRTGRPGVLLSLFVAVFPDEQARLDLKRRLPPRSRPTRPEKWHVTLAFLGDVPDDHTADVARALTGTPTPGPLTLGLAGGGRFGTVLWAGLAGDVDRLAALRESIHTTLTKAGFPIDERPFRPHLTVSYRFDPAIRDALRDYTGPSWQVHDFALVRSTTGEYHRLHTWPA
ncbi:RNA 2',3'-cyclic phosphodiesterase [Actinoplanes sp. NPDC051861]|uniref:RNA 2',3'-cyclic phosphodiesterase n=1 Tax=Actinoplanes sp. NPDC051861 TaxID=3155170 RepID=UPI0034392A08